MTVQRILHFGMPKTGSSSVHRTLLHVPPDTGVRYLHDHGINLSRGLATIAMDDPESFAANARRALTPEVLERQRRKLMRGIEAALQQEQGQAVILSAEMLTGMRKPAIDKLAEWLKPVAPGLVLAGYVRDPYSFVDSMFQTAVRNGVGKFNLERHYPAYVKRFHKLEKAFGTESVRYFAYNPKTFVQGDVVHDFAARFGIDSSAWTLWRANVSLSRDAVCLLYMYRKHGPREPRGTDAVKATVRFMRALESLKGPKARLASSVLRPLIEENEKDIAWMQKRLDQPMEMGIREDDALSIRNEDDLLRLTDAAFEWLKQRDIDISGLGTPAQPNAQGVCDAMHVLYQRSYAAEGVKKPKPAQPTL